MAIAVAYGSETPRVVSSNHGSGVLTPVNTSIFVSLELLKSSDSTEYRYVLSPGQDVTNESAEVQAIANAVWTEELVAAYSAFIADQVL